MRVRRVLTDNAKADTVARSFQGAAAAADVRLSHTRPYRPQTNGKAERFIQILQNEWAYARPYRSNAERLRQSAGSAALARVNCTRRPRTDASSLERPPPLRISRPHPGPQIAVGGPPNSSLLCSQGSSYPLPRTRPPGLARSPFVANTGTRPCSPRTSVLYRPNTCVTQVFGDIRYTFPMRVRSTMAMRSLVK